MNHGIDLPRRCVEETGCSRKDHGGQGRRGGALSDHVQDAFLAAAAFTRGLAAVTRNTGAFRYFDVETLKPWVAGPRRVGLQVGDRCTGETWLAAGIIFLRVAMTNRPASRASAGIAIGFADGWRIVHCAFGTGAGKTCVPVRYAIACVEKRSRSTDAVQSSPPVKQP